MAQDKRRARLPCPVCLAVLAFLSGSFLGCASLRCTSDSCRADARISMEVRELFREHAALEAPTEIAIQTVHRVVYLRGLVSTPYEIELAAQVASQAQGVLRVVNLIALDNSR
jgi:osmotically-inducible protein OsmY